MKHDKNLNIEKSPETQRNTSQNEIEMSELFHEVGYIELAGSYVLYYPFDQIHRVCKKCGNYYVKGTLGGYICPVCVEEALGFNPDYQDGMWELYTRYAGYKEPTVEEMREWLDDAYPELSKKVDDDLLEKIKSVLAVAKSEA